ncbi:MAG: division/cell wall cluster transcriptional repressor MraZ [Clostridia bacterium]|nr:division/cell wall cluster transcriptional repressor MraZ [Oscillospiraceae bacterium]MDY5627921.1 division/cell wall cluster transcriptional repressor MraZ [Clostridia bacterium]
MSYGFSGEYQHSVDAKGRMIVPSKFRDLLGETFMVTRGLDNCLFVYPKEAWEAFTQKLKQLPISNTNARQFVRFFLSGAVECELDKQGRILLPQNLRTYADISKDVAVIGVGERAEIWNSEQWKAYNGSISPDEVASNMESLGI